jgi:hypothetical protein
MSHAAGSSARQNKANFHPWADQKIGVPKGRACGTKPISGPAGHRGTDYAKRSQSAGASVMGAGWRVGPVGVAGLKRTKRTQFWRSLRFEV